MSVDYRDARSENPRRSKNFWTPIWITAVIGAGGIAFSVGQYLTQQQWAEADKNALAVELDEQPPLRPCGSRETAAGRAH